MSGLWRDVRLGLRALRRAPGVTLAILASLGLGIGAVATAFAWYEGWVLRPIAHSTEQDRLVWLNTQAPGGGTWAVSYPVSHDWREQLRMVESMTVFNFQPLGLREDGVTTRVYGLLTGANYFDVLGVRPMLGRGFRQEEEDGAVHVAVLGHRFWETHFRSDSAIVGRALNLGGHDFTVIGVAPPRFGGSYPGLTFDVYLPITAAALLSDGGARQLQQRDSQWLEALGRLAPGVTMEQARAEARDVGRRLEETFPGSTMTPVLTPMREYGPAGALGPVLLAEIGITLLVLLIACANVANLLLGRATARQREIGVRMAVGAARGNIVRQLLVESALLALGGGLLGLLVAYAGRNLMLAFVPPAPFPIGGEVAISLRVVGFTALIAVATVLVFGLLPAWRASGTALAPALREDATGGGRGSRLRGALVAGQVALSLVALVSAGLFLRGLQRAGEVDPGYADPDRLLLVTTDLRMSGTLDSTAGREMLDRALARLRSTPGVTAIAASHFVPLGFGGNSSSGIRVEGYEPAEDENMSVQYSVVTPGYFETVGMPIVAGRALNETDRTDGPPVAVVNETFVRRYLAGQNPVGRRYRQGGQEIEIVGVARDAKYQDLDEAPIPFLYRPLSQRYRTDLHLHIRTAGAPAGSVEELRRAMFAVAPDLPFLDPRTMTDQMVPATIVQRIGAAVLGLFGGLALLLSAIGIYGVVAYSVAQRTRELGVRMALGATGPKVIRLVLGQGLRLTLVGVVIGALLALGVGRLLASQLFGLNPADPLTFGVLIVVLGAVAAAASILPARRAARVDPVVALKGE